MKKGTSIHPAAILYCKIDNPIAKFSENKDEEQIDEEILKQSKMKGLLAKDAHIIKKMDKALYEEDVKNSLIVPAGLNKDGSLSKSTNSVTYQEFEILRKYVKHEIKDLCEGMLGGDISISPINIKTGLHVISVYITLYVSLTLHLKTIITIL